MSSYDLQSLNLPKLTGLPLRLFAAALDQPATRALLLPILLKQGGIDRLRELRLSEDPTLYPFTLVPERATGPLSPAETEAALVLSPTPQPLPAGFARARDYAAAYRTGNTTPLEVAERALQAIAASNAAQPPLLAIIASDREDVLAQARAATRRLQAGQPLSLLDGVPVAIKDEISQAPYPTRVGTTFLGEGPVQDCTVVARLRAAGALLLGKANMNELGLDPSGFNAHTGTTRNPYDPTHDPGGSSCGPAAAVAAGLCPLAIGCDGGGSIRIPASLCGVVGLKPTFGRVSAAGSAPLCPSVDAIGPLGVSAEDVALAYGLIAGPDPRDPRSQFQPPVELAGWNAPSLDGLTLGIYPAWFQHASPAVVSACEAMLQQLIAAGAQLREVEVPDLDAMRIAHVVTILGEQAANLRDHREHLCELGAPTRVTLAISQAFTTVDYVQAQRVRTRAIAAFEEIFQQVAVLLTPATAICAPSFPPGGLSYGWSDLSATTEKMRYAFPANLTGYPAISFPAGYDPSGLPIGMQAMGPYWSELTLLRIASAAEQVLERRPPPVCYPVLG